MSKNAPYGTNASHKRTKNSASEHVTRMLPKNVGGGWGWDTFYEFLIVKQNGEFEITVLPANRLRAAENGKYLSFLPSANFLGIFLMLAKSFFVGNLFYFYSLEHIYKKTNCWGYYSDLGSANRTDPDPPH